MPTVARVGPYRLYFYSHEPNEPPHVHVDRDDYSAKYWLADGEPCTKPGVQRPGVETSTIVVEEYRTELLEAWHGYFGRGSG